MLLSRQMSYQTIWSDVISIYARIFVPATVMIILVHVQRILLLVTSQMYYASYNDDTSPDDSSWPPFHHNQEDSRYYRWFHAEPQTSFRSILIWSILTGVAFAMEILSRFHMHAFLARSVSYFQNVDRTSKMPWIDTWRVVHQKCSVGCMILVFFVTICHNKLYGETLFLLLAALFPSNQHDDPFDVALILLELITLVYFVGPMLLVIPVYMNENDDKMNTWRALGRAWQLASGYRCYLYLFATSIMTVSELATDLINYSLVWVLFGKSTPIANLLHWQLQHIVLAPMTCV